MAKLAGIKEVGECIQQRHNGTVGYFTTLEANEEHISKNQEIAKNLNTRGNKMRAWIYLYLSKVESPDPVVCSDCGSRGTRAYGLFRFTNRHKNALDIVEIGDEVRLEKVMCPACFEGKKEESKCYTQD